MFNKLAISIIFIITNIMLYALMMNLEKYPDLHLLFILVRAILFTSVIMQILIAIGYVKLGKG